jgi:hypothetical protein
MAQLTARPHRVQAALGPVPTRENLLGQASEAAKMTIRSTPFANVVHIHG